MNLQPLTIEDIPIGVPLPWRIFDSYGYTVFAPGDIVADRKSIESQLADGLLRDVDGLPEARDAPEWAEIRDLPPARLFPPLGVRPQIWESLQVRLLGRDAQVRHAARLIGYIRDRSILITTPEADGRHIDIVEDERVEVRMLAGGNIFVFQTAVQRLCVSPVHYLHLHYPTRVLTQALRRSPWARVDLPAAVVDAQGSEEFAQVVNLSANGAKLQVPLVMGAPGDRLRLTLRAGIDDMKTTLVLDAVIRHVRPVRSAADDGRSAWEHGVAFGEVSTENALWLRCLVYERIAEGHPA